MKEIISIILMTITAAAVIIFFNMAIKYFDRNNAKLEKALKEIDILMQEEREYRDSLYQIVKNHQPADVADVNNYYINKYENEAVIIRFNDVDNDISYFAKWYYAD